MTLFTLLIVMALERVTVKSKQFHIAALAQQYFDFLQQKGWLKQHASMLACICVVALPSALAWIAVEFLPGVLVFVLYLVSLWVCLGCPVTRATYKRYLQAANRHDFEACSLYSESFGNKGGDLSQVGKQLVLINYRQYASVIIFFVVLGVPGMVFYSLVKELCIYKQQQFTQGDSTSELSTETKQVDSGSTNHAKRLLFVLDVVPARITAFGFLLVGHFSKGLGAWLDTLFNLKLDAYDLLARVAKASEDLRSEGNAALDDALQMVKLVKRNIVFLLMAISIMTMVGAVA